MRIDRCYCYHTTFAELKVTAEEAGCATLPQLRRHAVFGQRCRLCHPYVRRMLRTGQVVFHRVLTERDEPE